MSLNIVGYNTLQNDFICYEVDDYEQFLLNYRHTLVNVIEVEEATNWLRNKTILDKQDEESIVHGHKTSVLKAGDLIDAVTRRGRNGFNALMEFIEYEYPEIFKKMMGKAPRKPDPRVYIPSSKSSLRLSVRSKDAIEQIFRVLADGKAAREKAERSMKELQEQIEDAENKLEMKHVQILELTEKSLDLISHNRDLMEQVQQAEKEAREAIKQQEMFYKERDKCREECQKQKDKLMVFPIKIKSSKVHHSLDSGLFLNVPSSNSESVQIKQLKDIISGLENETEQLKKDNSCLNDQLIKAANQRDLIESSNCEYKNQVESLKAERNQIVKQFIELKEKCERLQQENNTHKDKLMECESKLRILNNENHEWRFQMTRQARMTHHRKNFQRCHSVSDSEILGSADSHPSGQHQSTPVSETTRDTKLSSQLEHSRKGERKLKDAESFIVAPCSSVINKQEMRRVNRK